MGSVITEGAARPSLGGRTDRRTVRTRRALRDALAAEVRESGGLDRVVVNAIAERADVTRRTFYSHFKDIADLVQRSEDELLGGMEAHIRSIAATTLDELYDGLNRLEPCPGAVELLEYIKENGEFMCAMLGPGGDPAFAEKIKRMACEAVRARAQDGIDASALGPFFEYYLAYAVSAEVGVVQKWLEGDMSETPEVMARVMTVLAFVRPGDLYGKPIDLNLPIYSRMVSHPDAAAFAIPSATATEETEKR